MKKLISLVLVICLLALMGCESQWEYILNAGYEPVESIDHTSTVQMLDCKFEHSGSKYFAKGQQGLVVLNLYMDKEGYTKHEVCSSGYGLVAYEHEQKEDDSDDVDDAIDAAISVTLMQ